MGILCVAGQNASESWGTPQLRLYLPHSHTSRMFSTVLYGVEIQTECSIPVSILVPLVVSS
jgi:hypothetical protein